MRKQIAPIVLMALLGQSEAARLMNTKRQLLAQTANVEDGTGIPTPPAGGTEGDVASPDAPICDLNTDTEPASPPAGTPAGIAVGEPHPAGPDAECPTSEPASDPACPDTEPVCPDSIPVCVEPTPAPQAAPEAKKVRKSKARRNRRRGKRAAKRSSLSNQIADVAAECGLAGVRNNHSNAVRCGASDFYDNNG